MTITKKITPLYSLLIIVAFSAVGWLSYPALVSIAIFDFNATLTSTTITDPIMHRIMTTIGFSLAGSAIAITRARLNSASEAKIRNALILAQTLLFFGILLGDIAITRSNLAEIISTAKDNLIFPVSLPLSSIPVNKSSLLAGAATIAASTLYPLPDWLTNLSRTFSRRG